MTTRPRLAALLLLLVVLALGTGCGLVGWDWDTKMTTVMPKSDFGKMTHEIFMLISWTTLIIFIAVEAALVYACWRFRDRPGAPIPKQVHGNTPLEIGWTVGAASILIVLTVVTFLYLDDIENPPASGPNGLNTAQFASVDQPNPPRGGGPFLTIRVNGQQYIWRYDYLNSRKQLFSYNRMVVPTDTTVVLKIESSDVIHSWWIPKFGPKADAVPGYTNDSWFKVPAGREGLYRGQCAELCGPNHADMRAQVRAVTPDEFRAWADRKSAQIQAAGEALARQRKEREGAGQ